MKTALYCVFALVLFAAPFAFAGESAVADKPNMWVVYLDDARLDDMPHMPNIQALIKNKGVSFRNAYTAAPLCTPSRVSLMTGLYPHNHGVLTNELPQGAYQGFAGKGHESANIAVWLQQLGYRTRLDGKYLNKYPGGFIPPGWSEFDAIVDIQGYDSEGMRDRSVDFIHRTKEPFFLYLAPLAPHLPYRWDDRFKDMFRNMPEHRPPSYNVPDGINDFRAMNAEEIVATDRATWDRRRALLGFDDLIAHVIAALEAAGKMSNTYIIFTNDNGWMLGEHRFSEGKNNPYDEANRVPLYVVGPGVPAGKNLDHLVSLVDIAPTLLDLAGARASTPEWLDGKSLSPLLTANPPAPETFRRTLLYEDGLRFTAVRTQCHVLIEWWYLQASTLYNMEGCGGVPADPYQLRNLLPNEAPPEYAVMRQAIGVLEKCYGAGCRQ